MVEHILGISGEADLIDELTTDQAVKDRINTQHF